MENYNKLKDEILKISKLVDKKAEFKSLSIEKYFNDFIKNLEK